MDRKNFIGGSDIAAIMGLSRWRSPLQVWAEKTGKIEKQDLSDIEAVEWGTRLEKIISEKFQEENNVKLMAYKKRYCHKQYPYMTGEIDRLIVGTNELVEIKTCSAWKYKEWENEEIPTEYIMQVIWYLGLTERQIGHFAVLIGGQKYIQKKIEFDSDLFNQMVTSAKHFWDNNIKNDIPPAVCALDNDSLLNLYPNNATDEMIEANQEIESAIAYRQELSGQVKKMEKEIKEIDAKIKKIIGENSGLLTEKYKVTWKSFKRISIDLEKLKEANLYDKYSKESTTRYFRINNRKEK